jgi:hypothetical protein
LFLKAAFALELEAGVIEKTKIKKGDYLDFWLFNRVELLGIRINPV